MLKASFQHYLNGCHGYSCAGESEILDLLLAVALLLEPFPLW